MQHLQGAFRAVASSNMLSATGAELCTHLSDKPTGGRAGATFPNTAYAQIELAQKYSNHIARKQAAHHRQTLGDSRDLRVSSLGQQPYHTRQVVEGET